MAEYIEREKLLSHLFNKQDKPLDVMREITEFPAADVAPVRHGRWITGFENFSPYQKCSTCGLEIPQKAIWKSVFTGFAPTAALAWSRRKKHEPRGKMAF